MGVRSSFCQIWYGNEASPVHGIGMEMRRSFCLRYIASERGLVFCTAKEAWELDRWCEVVLIFLLLHIGYGKHI